LRVGGPGYTKPLCRDRERLDVPSDHLPDLEAVLAKATVAEREHYHELMRHDPISGDVYLQALSIRQGER
jgi:hypothetical protein